MKLDAIFSSIAGGDVLGGEQRRGSQIPLIPESPPPTYRNREDNISEIPHPITNIETLVNITPQNSLSILAGMDKLFSSPK